MHLQYAVQQPQVAHVENMQRCHAVPLRIDFHWKMCITYAMSVKTAIEVSQ